MLSKVYFITMRANFRENFIEKLSRLLQTAGILKIISKKDIVSVKLHFGELGNTAFIRPVYISKIVKIIKKANAYPFLTDANTLYVGTRSNAPNHLTTALKNGFAPSVVDAPLIIADGLRGKSETLVDINRKHFKSVYVAKEIFEADVLISTAHFKGHELSGFGGTIKNLGMGCASRRGKLAQHSSFSPKIKSKKCENCGNCIKRCSQKAIQTINQKVTIDSNKCNGCGECITTCRNNAVQIVWNKSVPIFMEKMIEYTEGVLASKKNKALFINFITDVSPACDCHPMNDAPIVKDIGVVCSNDPVAIDQASVDLVNKETVLAGTCLKHNIESGKDKFKGMYPDINWEIQLEYAEKLKLGTRKYKLITL